MLITEITIPVGAEKPFRMLHMSDNHLSLADERDNERKNTLAAARANAFTGNHPEKLLENLADLMDFAKKENLTILHTGDMIDFVSEANMDYTKKAFEGADVFAAAGNHEFSQYVGEAWEDEEYKAQSFAHVKEAFPGDFWFQTRIVNGVKFIAVDNNYYYVTEEQLHLFRDAVSDGMPAVLIMHNPLYSEDMYAKVTAGKKPQDPPYLFGCPEPLLRTLDDHRYRQQKPDETAVRFLELCNSLPNLKAVLSGHLHKYFASQLDSGVPQYVAGAGYHAEANLYTFI
ncbi:MAG: metallophosphoesterase [Clostridia bacterium]|nr:metallophosphoesterase [Clostridia bacterium]